MNAPVSIDHEALAASLPLSRFNPADPALYQDDVWMPYFRRLRREDPVHFCAESRFGPYWSITRYRDIMKVEANHQVFSSDAMLGGITVRDAPVEFRRPMFIAMDPPKHDEQRAVVQPMFTPDGMRALEGLIRQRTALVLDSLPRNETFDWVDKVSIELTTMMLATLFDFPFEDRRLLPWWSDVATADITAGGPIDSDEKRDAELQKCLGYFSRLWQERIAKPPQGDLLSMMAHAEATRNMAPKEFLGNLILLIVGGNDTTRNSMSGSVLFMHENPQEMAKLRANPALLSGMVPEVFRYQTPLAHMRRTALADAEIGGKTIRKGDKVVMWYISANRDDTAIERPDEFIIDRRMPKRHVSFGFGIHRCVGERLAELQLRVLWEEILQRFDRIEVMGPPKRVFSSFVHGITQLPVRIPG